MELRGQQRGRDTERPVAALRGWWPGEVGQNVVGGDQAMLHEPAVMLLDEPYTGLDVNGAKMLDDLLHEWKSLGRTVIMSTHDLDRVTQHCDHVLILNNGKIITNQSTTEIPDLAALFTASIPV